MGSVVADVAYVATDQTLRHQSNAISAQSRPTTLGLDIREEWYYQQCLLWTVQEMREPISIVVPIV